jgi:nitrogen regulatory protein P-II 1
MFIARCPGRRPGECKGENNRILRKAAWRIKAVADSSRNPLEHVNLNAFSRKANIEAVSNATPGKIRMKLIIAIIQPARLEAVKAALTEVEVFRLTVMDVQGFGRQKGHTEVYRGHEFTVNLLRKVQLQIAVNEEFVEPTVDAIIKGGRTGEKGEIGDGKIFVLPLDDCIRIRTGERGGEAI